MDINDNAVIKTHICRTLKVIKMYDWLLNMYVLDFFVDNHWNRLPESWRQSFQNIDPRKLGSILNGTAAIHMFPLSFLALLESVKLLNIPRNANRNPVNIERCVGECGSHPKLKNLFLKHVKLKKRHEISLMAKVVNDTAHRSSCEAVIDFGSGLGHLVRMLGYKYDMYAAGIECQLQLTEEARKLDLELEYTANKHLPPAAMSKLHRPTHFNITLSSQDQLSQLPLPPTMSTYGLIGLHPCGDLGPLLLRHFVNSDQVKFICLVGCCYMKLSSQGYPMSEYVRGLDSDLSYTSKEIACHAIECYRERLMEGAYEDLKIHAYRASLESILVGISPKLKHAKIRSIKHTDSMTFERYCRLALHKLDIPAPSPQALTRGASRLSEWRRVLTVYSLRLSLAPLVETVILLDRVLFVLENGMSCEIHPVFDPKLSPRNHIIIGTRS